MKTVFITGGTRNTGLAIARRFAREGYQVAVSSRDAQAAEDTAAQLAQEFGIRAKGYALTFDRVENIRQVFQNIRQDFGTLDVFVANSANLGIGFDLCTTTEADFDAIVDVNLKGNFFCCQCAAELMKARGGSIVTMGSVQGTGAVAGRAVYGLTKAALSQLVRSMAYELGQYGIRANNVGGRVCPRRSLHSAAANTPQDGSPRRKRSPMQYIFWAQSNPPPLPAPI